MPTTPAEVYFPVLVQILLAGAIALTFVALGFLLGKRVKSRVKDSVYESGVQPTGDARQRFSVKFYLVAMLFILFDMEAIFLYPWAVVYKDLRLFGFFEMLLFIVLVLCGYFYIWKKGVLDWATKQPEEPLH